MSEPLILLGDATAMVCDGDVCEIPVRVEDEPDSVDQGQQTDP
jgi:hypothetical protein